MSAAAPQPGRLAVVTGASAGIGAATARGLADAGFELLLGARRTDRLEAVAAPLGARWQSVDVTDDASVAAFAAGIDELDLLVANAGAAFGLDRVESADEALWRSMYELNVLGVVRIVKALLPALRARQGHIIVVGSTSSFETYVGGAGYTASKHALRAIVRTLRLELLGEPLRVTEITPGLADTEFARVRFAGDEARARKVYQGMQPLVAEDVAACIVFAATRPPHVNVDEIVVRPRDQANSQLVHRRAE